jgi:Ca-activated chloride channel family protein
MNMKSSIISMIAFGIVFLATSSAAAQDEVVNVETNIVTLNVAVTDKSGNYVKGLKKSDFSLTDNAMRQDIDTFSSEQAPISFGIVYDLHPSTEEHTSTVLAALEQFVKGLRAEDTYFVTVFNEKGSLTTEFVPSREQLDKFLAEKDARAANSLYDAIFAASEKVRKSGNSKKVLLVLTDGADHTSHHSLKELRLHLRSINLPVYSMTFSNTAGRIYGYTDIYGGTPRRTLGRLDYSDLDRGAIAEISKATGGQSFEDSIRNKYYLAGLLGKVSDEVRNQYVLGFYPDKLDGRWHRLKVAVDGQRSKKLKVSNRKGYQSPKRG